jgi:predicted amidohydrolase
MRTSLVVAAAQPRCHPGDVARNARAHADLVRRAGARLVVFPELSLTGYDVDAPTVDPDDPALDPLRRACAETGSTALVGAAIRRTGRHYIATLSVERSGTSVAYRKTWLDSSERQRFSRGDGPTVLPVDGWRFGLAICKDTGSAQHTVGTAAREVDAYLAGVVHRPEELAEQEARATVIARTCRAHVVVASAAGPVGPDYPATCGTSAIWAPSGSAITRAGPEPDDVVHTAITRHHPSPG